LRRVRRTRRNGALELSASECSLRKSKEASDAATSKKDAHPTEKVSQLARHLGGLLSSVRIENNVRPMHCTNRRKRLKAAIKS
jgi:hypothetical protein